MTIWASIGLGKEVIESVVGLGENDIFKDFQWLATILIC